MESPGQGKKRKPEQTRPLPQNASSEGQHRSLLHSCKGSASANTAPACVSCPTALKRPLFLTGLHGLEGLLTSGYSNPTSGPLVSHHFGTDGKDQTGFSSSSLVIQVGDKSSNFRKPPECYLPQCSAPSTNRIHTVLIWSQLQLASKFQSHPF